MRKNNPIQIGLRYIQWYPIERYFGQNESAEKGISDSIFFFWDIRCHFNLKASSFCNVCCFTFQFSTNVEWENFPHTHGNILDSIVRVLKRMEYFWLFSCRFIDLGFTNEVYLFR